MSVFHFFSQQSYSTHTTCISEKEKYDSANFKNVVSKGAAKQKNWTSSVHSKLRNYNAPSGVPTLMKKKLLESSNVPRKKAKFEVSYCPFLFLEFSEYVF